MYTDILIPTDGSDNVEPAIQYGLELARRYDATVHALHVVDSSPIERKLELTALETDLETLPDTWYEAGDAATKQIETRAAEHGLDAVTEVRRGIPAREIRSYITDTGIDLVCMGTRGHTGLDRVLLGSVTTRLVRTVDIPVLSVKAKQALSEPGMRGGFETILVPTDGSKPAREAVTHALDLARTYDATLHALYVVDRGAYASRPGWTWDELQQVLEQNGETVLEDVQSRATADGVSVAAEITHGVPHQAIGDYCDQHGIDLVVMGTHGRSSLSRRIIGSVTERVLRNSDEPVLTIRGV
ncbi:universal stress protein [Halomicroarcula sp. F13]|jgi:nucleotide-binding universal stress UspA family protein|uniref:Universal stress protein n=3 Tax=Halobacteriales TaxID=2235 RepID=A0A8J8TBI2_9EURY|nr:MULTISPECIES: universal stress protein [Halobacteria]MBX0324980.1 universal stress protein [Halomicroarcula rubra]MDS0261787.1 universal stress protein [Haloarcula sp. S1CR25-12]MDT3437523.1 universal stress protein [Haloarcula sp. 1CSR25-25]RDZ44565.1 universal stress protein [Haloferax sp. Atlit-16N]RDZ53733.1 universal stress protein [Haloferax sp. Atlit-10N]